MRDGQYSWPNYSDTELMGLPEDQMKFLYLERNNAGFCIRIEKSGDGSLKAAGDGPEWIPKWPEISKKVESHYEEKLKK